jgi:hypothetical protein
VRRILISIVCAAAAGGALLAASAQADFPYAAPGTDTKDYSALHTNLGQTPNDMGGSDVWKFAATPEDNNFPVNNDARENNGIRGGYLADSHPVPTGWTVSTGRPDVVIAELDSGVDWRDAGFIEDIRFKIRINRGELPTPNHAGPALVSGANCASYQAKDDANGDGVFNLRDFACDDRLSQDEPHSVGPAKVLDPQDLLIAFSDGSDADGNGYADDIAGWDFLDNDNDAYDDVHYGHGTGEITGSSAEANNGHSVGTCPNCMAIPLRVGNSFIADDTRFGLATIYAVDMGVSIVQEALGTLNSSGIGQDAIDYAYKHGVVVIASAADEAAQHHNWPSSHAKPIVVNSVRDYNSDVPEVPRTYLSFNGCTNFSSKITLAIPSTSCSSNATEVAAGMAGVVYGAAMNAVEHGQLDPHPTCKRVDGSACPISANEVRQLMASGAFDGQTQPQDVNFNKNPLTGAPQPEPSCSPAPAPGCTDPNLALQTQVNANRPVVSPPDSRSYPARFGHDQFYGYGRVNTYNAAHQVAIGHVPPEVEITAPKWFAQVDPTKPTAGINAQVSARGAAYSCRVYVAPGSYPNNNSAPSGDFHQVDSPVCNGQSRTAAIDGQVAALKIPELKALFPTDATASDFGGTESGSGAGQTSNGRPNSEPYGFTVKVVATTTAENPGVTATGEDRRNLYLHRDQDMLPGFPKALSSDGESSPAFADLDGDNRNEMIFGTSDGYVHAMRRDGSELDGWPVRSDRLPLHAAERAFKTGEVSPDSSHGAVLASPAVADLNHDGSPEVIVGDMEGKLYAWNADGSVHWKREANPDYSGKPLEPFVNERLTRRDRTSHRFIGSPVAVDLDRSDGGRLEVVVPATDRHLYAYRANGSRVDGFPALVVDPAKVGSIDPQSHQVRWNPATAPLEGDNPPGEDDPDQGSIIDTPAVGNISGDAHPEILLGTNEEYHVNVGDEGPINVGGFNAASFQALAPALAAIGGSANGRLYAIKPTGDADGNPKTADWKAAGQWPMKIGILLADLLPEVGEGITGYPVIGRMSCLGGAAGRKVGVMPNNGFAYIANPDGQSCLGKQNGKDTPLDSDRSGGGIDHPQLAAVGSPAFANFGGGMSMVGPVAGLIRALDLVASEYQTGGEDYITAWDPTTGNMRPNFPQRTNDLQFLTGPSIADIDGDAGGELLEGSAYLDLQAYNGDGTAVPKFPKLNSDWTVANPLVGTWGTRDTDSSARRVVVNITRNGTILAYKTDAPPCEANAAHPLGDWPKFHHDLANSGDYEHDGTNPGAPYEVSFAQGALSFRAPGDDLLCGKADHYELVESDQRLTGANFDDGIPLPTPKPKAPGEQEKLTFSGKLQRFLAIRAVDEQGNVGAARVLDLGPGGPGPGPGGGGGGGKGSPSRCVDRTPPRSSIHAGSLKHRKGGLTVKGHTLDGGCLNAKAAKRFNNVIASIAVIRDAKHRKCRFLGRDGLFSKPRGCKHPIRLRAVGRYSLARHRLDWTVRTHRKLGRGKYTVIATAADQSGNVERKTTKKNRKVLRVKRASTGR